MSKANTQQCYGEPFEITGRFKFRVPSLDREYDSYEQMKAAIERSQKSKTKVAKKRMAIKAIYVNGEEVTPITITGIHAGHGHVLTDPPVKLDRWSRQCRIYPDSPKVRDIIERLAAAKESVGVLDDELSALEITSRTYSYSPEAYAEAFENLERIAAAAIKKAEKA